MSNNCKVTCYVCGLSEENASILTKCSQASYNRMKEFSIAWSQYGRKVELCEKLTTDKWIENSIFYHRHCYDSLTHKNNLNKLQKRIETVPVDSQMQKNVDFDLCVICQGLKKEVPSKVTSIEKAEAILKLKSTASAILKDRMVSLITAEDIFKKNIKYHSLCLLNEKKKALKGNSENVPIVDRYKQINDEFLRSILHELTSLGNSSTTLDINQLVNRYDALCRDSELACPASSMRRYVRNIITENQDLMAQTEFHQYAPSKPAVLANKMLASKLVCNKHFKDNEDDEPDFLNYAAKEIRNELRAMKSWVFSGTFDDFDVPPTLYQHIKTILSDNKPLTDVKQNEIDAITRNIVQYICSNFKSDRQVNYQSVKNRGFEKHRMTPMSVGTALVNYQYNKSKKEIEFLSNIGLTINYDKLERILTSIASTSIEVASKNELGIILPSCFKKGIRPVFAADNIDIGGDVSSFHGADLMIAQENDPARESLFPNFTFEVTSHRSLPSSLAPEIDENIELSSDEEARFRTALSIENSPQYSEHFQQLNVIWLLLSQSKLVLTPVRSDESQEIDECENNKSEGNLRHDENPKVQKVLSWSAFHSILSDPNFSLSNIAIVAPLYRRSPTEIPILMDILKRAMKISSIAVGEGKRTIITLDGDLYGRAVKIPNYKSKWIIRLGSLHTVIAALKCLGKYVEGSGIDVAWEASGMYGSATVNQVIEGRHIYRGIQAHTVTLIALCHLKIQSDIFTDEERQKIQSNISNIECDLSADIDKASFTNLILSIQQEFSSSDTFKKLQSISSRQTATFLDNYASQVMNMLNYIGATRIKNWMQHLSTTGDMFKYFHAHDQTNYSKWAIMYLADMIELESTDIESWTFLSEGNFAVSSNTVPFTSIDPDHAIEHQHKIIKSGKGISDIKDNESALERFVLTMPILSGMVDEFKRYSSVKPSYEKGKVHHELVGNSFANQLKNAQNLINVLSREGNPYEYNDLRHLMNFSVPRSSICNDVCKRDELGLKALNKFRKERMVYDSENNDDENDSGTNKVPFWSQLSRNNFQMFSDIHIILNDKQKTFTTLKKEKQLYARMLFVMKTRPELCPEMIIGEYEFTSVPPSNFSPDGSIIMSKSNEPLIKLIMSRPSTEDESNSDFEQPDDENSVIIVNAMDILETIKKRKPMNKVSDLTKHFLVELEKTIKGFSEVRLVFKRFHLNPLNDYKSKGQNWKNKQVIHYHVKNNTPIKSLDNFLAHVDTQIELTTFLGQKVFARYEESTIKFLVAYGSKYFMNKSLTGFTNLRTDHRFVDIKQIILSNVVDISNANRNRILTIVSTGVDLIILLVGLFHHIPPYTTVTSDQKSIVIMDLYHRLGYKLSGSIIGWYAFHGMKDQGSFYGKGVRKQFQTFLKADDAMLCAFDKFGTSLEIPDSLKEQIERFVCLLYTTKGEKSVKELRFLMSGDGKDGNQLPPTMGTLVPHMSRAYYQTLAFKMSILPNPDIPPPTNYCWDTTSEGYFVPIKCNNPPAPEAILELKKCGCAKSDCSRDSCKCRKNNLVCCGLCTCGDGCTNTKKKDVELNSDDLRF